MTSIWNETVRPRRYAPLRGDRRVDVAVIGGGIAGLTTARFLKEAGRTVAVLEARRLGAQVTGSSTGKVTSQHGLIYADLMERDGRETAQACAEAAQWALDEVAAFVASQGIACDFERPPAFVVAQLARSAERLEREREAAATLNCSCHGFRFEAEGALLHGPARRGLKPRPLS